MVEISRLTLKNLVVAHARGLFPDLDAVTGRPLVTVYNGKPGIDPAYLPPTIDADGHVRQYVCVYPSPGAPSEDVDLAELHNDLDWSFQLTAVAAYDSDLDDLFDRLVPGFRAWVPTLPAPENQAPEINVGRCRQLNIPGPHFPDRSQTPDRVMNVLQYGISLTT